MKFKMTWDKLAVLLVVLIFFALFRWLPNALVAPAIKLTNIKRHDPNYYIENFSVTAMNSEGTPKYTLQAKMLVHYPNDKNTRVEKPNLIQYEQKSPAKNAPTITTTADTGWISADGKKLLMVGNVKVMRAQDNEASQAQILTKQLSILLN